MVKNSSAMQERQEMWVQSLSERFSGEGKATHSSILNWKSPWTEEPGGLQSVGSQRSPIGLSNQTTKPKPIAVGLGKACFHSVESLAGEDTVLWVPSGYLHVSYL